MFGCLLIRFFTEVNLFTLLQLTRYYRVKLTKSHGILSPGKVFFRQSFCAVLILFLLSLANASSVFRSSSSHFNNCNASSGWSNTLSMPKLSAIRTCISTSLLVDGE